jgi:hypothetical protein
MYRLHREKMWFKLIYLKDLMTPSTAIKNMWANFKNEEDREMKYWNENDQLSLTMKMFHFFPSQYG